MDYGKKNLFARLDYAFLDEHEISFDYTYDTSKDTVGGVGYYYKPSAENYIFSLEPKYQGGFLTYNGKLSDIFSLYSNFGIAKRDYRIISGAPNYEPIHFINKENNTLYKEDILQGELKGTANLLSDDRLRVIAGAQYKKTKLAADGYDAYGGVERWKEKESNISPYTQLEFKPIKYLLFIAGVRHDIYDTAGRKMRSTNPNFGLSVFPFAGSAYDYTTLWTSYSKAFKTPSGNERFLPDWLGGNPDLKPERSKGYEIGVKQRIGEWGKVDISYFKTDYKDMIRLIDIGGFQWKFRNEDEATYKGFEVTTEIYPTSLIRVGECCPALA